MQFNEPEGYVMEAIKNSPADYEWWLRLHPRTLSTQPYLEQVLKDNGILEMVEINKATQYSLPSVLRNTAVHVSNYSGSVIEGAQLGVKTIILNDVGVATYSGIIDSGDAVACLSQSATELLQTIERLNNEEDKKAGNTHVYKEVIKSLLAE